MFTIASHRNELHTTRSLGLEGVANSGMIFVSTAICAGRIRTMADIEFNCPKCQGSLIVDAQGAGRKVKCPQCGEVITIPSPSGPVPVPSSGPPAAPAAPPSPTETPAQPGPSPIRFLCPDCHKPVVVEAANVSRQVFCTYCGNRLYVPTEGGNAAPAAAAKDHPTEPGKSSIHLAGHSPHKICPECKADIDLEDIVCVNCGLNLVTGQRADAVEVRPTWWYVKAIAMIVVAIVVFILAIVTVLHVLLPERRATPPPPSSAPASQPAAATQPAGKSGPP
jgi:predicted Zn finger-like uncharacterized protein